MSYMYKACIISFDMCWEETIILYIAIVTIRKVNV